MDFESIFRVLLEDFKKNNIDFALIGGFAISALGQQRTTQDIDFLIPQEELYKIKKILTMYGYELIHESEDVANFAARIKQLGRVDFLLAHRKYTKAMLKRAQNKDFLNGKFRTKVVTPEDLIGLKIQAITNNPERYHQDMADIENLLKANLKNINWQAIEEYFIIFKKEDELKSLRERLKDA
ncbi:hypothetical protein A2291_06150 [candidate division WOR-1 bacterium RIFOXYB2_FULL_42_35]|uniref:Polymerase nucleotidyl transferase domain-containing protein n=1 Tax=candidate division WOR-1 bacterium RIFOXYC2_FULL_41_25 TaxID=1802586 RepID=A0A1F4TR82_UNCSA|nr:MAG: hypothetical protein A2247_04030 [candidate division WOR-1 bacterium RIFOXYA2_FULL_41_14]OGC24969.1 MAG: hypothetical protein A2291_06150 [candidate division WOR-1 bacterium RIFOXYB2_FULL_42_35]OGC35168.1 MAG: hypothetical protein A2462_02105 [candidate division WOR-1 bacterium RIFOXYC2_FULL_41_25]